MTTALEITNAALRELGGRWDWESASRFLRAPREVAERYGARRVYTDHHDLLADPAIRAVSIATPDFAHAEIAQQPIDLEPVKGGKHFSHLYKRVRQFLASEIVFVKGLPGQPFEP